MKKYLDQEGLLYLWQKVKANFAKKTDVPTKVSQLTNDAGFLTTAPTYADATTSTSGLLSGADKTKLNGIQANAQTNVLEHVSVNGTKLSVSNKGVNVSVPTNNTQLANGKKYQTDTDVANSIREALKGITGIRYEKVTSLPSEGQNGVIYLLSNGGSNNNSYDEFIYYDSKFEKIGTTDIDLSGYLQKSDVSSITNGDIDKIVK